MADPIKISTGKYRKEGKVEIDGMVWSIMLPGAATELRLSQGQRRLDYLEKKVDKGTATEADLDKCDKIEEELYDAMKGVFSDGTKDNASVVKWLEETPLPIIMQVVDDIKEQANGRAEAPTGS